MDWLWFLLSVILGAVLMLGAQALLLAWYIHSAPGAVPTEDLPPVQEPTLPKELTDLGIGTDCAGALSLAMQFLLQELKFAPAPLAWLHRKLSQEMEDLLTRTTSGKLLESLSVRTISMGDWAPCVRWAGVDSIERWAGGRLRSLDLLLDIHYEGGFRLAVDAAMLLGKSACLDIQVEQLTGRARVRFTRHPYTHWSLSFVTPPHLELRASPLRGRLAALLQAHARRALQRKHTLPNYTIRYKPFFTKIDPAQLDPPAEDPTLKIQGNFDITVSEVTRLFTEVWTGVRSNQNEQVYCCVSLDSNPWISYRQDDECSTFTLDIVINKDRTQQLGTVFKQVSVSSEERNPKTTVVIETVVPLSAAYKADLRRGDVIVAVDNKLVFTMSQVAKIVKSVSRPCFTVRIERRVRRICYQDEGGGGGKVCSKQDTLTVGESDDSAPPKRGKSNSFSFRKMSEVLESARNVGNEGRALLRGTNSVSNMQESEKPTLNPTEPPISEDSQTTVAQSAKQPTTKAEDINVPKTTSQNIISFSKHSDSIQVSFGFGLRKRRCSVENRTSSDSSNSSTPTASSPGTPSKRTDKIKEPNLVKSNTEDLQKPKIASLESQNSIASNPETQTDRQSFSSDTQTKFIVGSFEDLSEDPTNPKISIIRPTSDGQSKVRLEVNEFSDMLQTCTTPPLPLSELLCYNERMTFKLNRNHRYLNLNVWGKNNTGGDDVLLAYLNIPLIAVLKECNKSKIGQSIRKFTLLPPEVNLSVSKTHPLASHSGFEPCLCYGDILFKFNWSTSPSEQKSSGKDQESNKGTYGDASERDREGSVGDFEMIEAATAATEEDGGRQGEGEEVRWKMHDFLRTHFHRSTQCDFCGKKIWLKDAVQCRDCALCCHKKCVAKCLSTGRCLPPTGPLQDDCTSPSTELPATIIQAPEFLMTEHLDPLGDSAPLSPLTHTASQDCLLITNQKSDEGSLGRTALAGLLGGLRRVGSAHSLAPPASPQTTARSLPPSPQHTPRRQSPEDECAWASLDAAIAAGACGAEQLLAPLLRVRQSPEQLLAGARDAGPKLMSKLAPEARAERLATLTTEVRLALDEESAKMSEIQSSLFNSPRGKGGDKSKQLQALAECEDRSHALTALLLHCCSAMQSINRDSMSSE